MIERKRERERKNYKAPKHMDGTNSKALNMTMNHKINDTSKRGKLQQMSNGDN